MTKINGLGMWVWQSNNWNNIVSNCKDAGIKWITAKMADTYRYPFWTTANLKKILDLCHKNDIALLGWNYSIVDTHPQQTQMIKSFFDDGIDGWVIDAEAEWEFYKNGPTDQIATQFMQDLRKVIPEGFIAHAPFCCPDFHSAFPYTSFNTYCDGMMDQAYWSEFGWTVDYTMQLTDQQWAKYYAKRPQITTPRLPIAPTYGRNNYGPSVKGNIYGADVIKFIDHYLPKTGIVGLYSYDACAPEVWKYLKDRHAGITTIINPPIQPQPTPISNPTPVPDLPEPPDNSGSPSPAPTQDPVIIEPNQNVVQQPALPQPMQPVQNGFLSFLINNFMQITNVIGQLLQWFKPRSRL